MSALIVMARSRNHSITVQSICWFLAVKVVASSNNENYVHSRLKNCRLWPRRWPNIIPASGALLEALDNWLWRASQRVCEERCKGVEFQAHIISNNRTRVPPSFNPEELLWIVRKSKFSQEWRLLTGMGRRVVEEDRMVTDTCTCPILTIKCGALVHFSEYLNWRFELEPMYLSHVGPFLSFTEETSRKFSHQSRLPT